jgi:hypothetical protein
MPVGLKPFADIADHQTLQVQTFFLFEYRRGVLDCAAVYNQLAQYIFPQRKTLHKIIGLYIANVLVTGNALHRGERSLLGRRSF